MEITAVPRATISGTMKFTWDALADAEDRFRKLNQANGDNTHALTGLVESMGSAGHFDEALLMLEDMLKKTPDSERARSERLRLLLADTAVAAGKYDLAIDNYARLLEQNSKSIQLYLALGKAHRLKGDLSAADKDFQIASARAPKTAVKLPDRKIQRTKSGSREASQVLASPPNGDRAIKS